MDPTVSNAKKGITHSLEEPVHPANAILQAPLIPSVITTDGVAVSLG